MALDRVFLFLVLHGLGVFRPASEDLCEAFGLACGVLRTSVTFNDLGASTGHTFVICAKTWRSVDGARRRSCMPGPQAVSAQKRKVPTVPITAIPAVSKDLYPHAYRIMTPTNA